MGQGRGLPVMVFLLIMMLEFFFLSFKSGEVKDSFMWFLSYSFSMFLRSSLSYSCKHSAIALWLISLTDLSMKLA